MLVDYARVQAVKHSDLYIKIDKYMYYHLF